MDKKNRILLLDVLRGFALVSIMLLHCIQHFHVFYYPDTLSTWMKTLDSKIVGTVVFLFGGKSYSIFALLFGVTYGIQASKQEVLGKSFNLRFAWRMLLLFVFGLINSAFFQGDVLSIYAVIGLFLIPLTKLPEKIIFILAILLLMLPYEWFNLIHAFQYPDEKIYDPVSSTYFGKMPEYVYGPSLWKTMVGNLTNGKIAVLLWNWEKGRFFSILGLFLLGYLMAKHHLFEWNERTERFWKRVLIIASSVFIPLYLMQTQMNELISSAIIRRSSLVLVTAWGNFAFMWILVSVLTLLFYKTKLQNRLMYFSSFGKMSLSNYIIQSIIGGVLFYGWGLGLYKYTGATYCILIGIVLTILMGMFCEWWERRHKQGPIETIWHKATWF